MKFKFAYFILSLLLVGIFNDSEKMLALGNNRELLLQNVNIVDVVSGKVIKSRDIIIEGDIIKSITRHKERREVFETIDLSGKYIMPGLIDAHVHLATDPKKSDIDRYEYLNYLISMGITTVRDAAGDARILKRLKASVESGEKVGPDIYYAAFLGGEPYFSDSMNRDGTMVEGYPEKYAPWLQLIKEDTDLDKSMESAKEWGCTGVKIYGGFDKKLLGEIVKKAKEHKLEVWAHSCLFPAKPRDVAKVGVKVLSHAYLLEWENVNEELESGMFDNFDKYEAKIDKDNINVKELFGVMVKNNLILDPTLLLSIENKSDWVAKVVREAFSSGVKICAGTDYIEDYSRPYPYLIDEMNYYVTLCGFTNADALRSATIIAAEALGKKDLYGSIEEKKVADMLVLNSNPLESLDALKGSVKVIKRGVRINNGK